jgi:hypothetical protein
VVHENIFFLVFFSFNTYWQSFHFCLKKETLCTRFYRPTRRRA